MELPKNITQIGEADRTCKVYVEDYVVSYMKQLCRRTEEKGLAIDATQGRKTKSVLVMENSQIALSALLPETLAGRVQAGAEALEEEEE